MAVIYVDSAAAGANNGTSWANAYTSLASATPAAAGSDVWVDDGHSENSNVATTTVYNFSSSLQDAPVRILCVDKATDLPSTGAQIRNTNAAGSISFRGPGLFVRGLTIEAGDDISVAGTSINYHIYEQCTFLLNGAASRMVFGTTQGKVSVDRCTFTFSGLATSAGPVILNGRTFVNLKNCSFSIPSGHTVGVFHILAENTSIIEDCSVDNGSLILANGSGTAASVRAVFRRCNFPAGADLVDALIANDNGASFENCSFGTISVPSLGLTHVETIYGTVAATLAVYRTGGADDGEQANAHSWAFATTAAAIEVYRPIDLPHGYGIARWVEGGAAITITVYFASGGTLQDDEFGIDLLGPSAAGSPTAVSYNWTSRSNPPATPANLTSDGSSTWNGSGVGTKQKISHSYTPAVSGWVIVRPWLGKASTTVYVDPQIEIT